MDCTVPVLKKSSVVDPNTSNLDLDQGLCN